MKMIINGNEIGELMIVGRRMFVWDGTKWSAHRRWNGRKWVHEFEV